MNPLVAIPADVRSEGASLLIGGRSVDDLIAEAGGTPLFVYDFGIVARRIARFRGAFPSVQLHYAIKANPYIPLLKLIFKTVNGLDVPSAGELRMALGRSEEHTSELQSLMRISYAVYCFKTKNIRL